MFNWYRWAKNDNIELVDMDDIVKLYELEKPYGVYLNKKRMGEPLTDSEQLAYLKSMHLLMPLVDKLGSEFYDIAMIIAETSFDNLPYDEYWCPTCFEEMDLYRYDRPIFRYPEIFTQEDFDFDMCPSYFACESCGFQICANEWEDYVRRHSIDMGSRFYTDFGLHYAVEYVQMWRRAETLSEKIIALQYIIHAIHGMGTMLPLFIERADTTEGLVHAIMDLNRLSGQTDSHDARYMEKVLEGPMFEDLDVYDITRIYSDPRWGFEGHYSAEA